MSERDQMNRNDLRFDTAVLQELAQDQLILLGRQLIFHQRDWHKAFLQADYHHKKGEMDEYEIECKLMDFHDKAAHLYEDKIKRLKVLKD